MIDWDSFVIRRSIDFENFSKQFNIKSVSDLLRVCQKLNVTPPSDSQILSLFHPKEEVSNVEPFVIEDVIEETIVENKFKQVVTKKSKKNRGVQK